MGILKRIFSGEKTIESFNNVFNKVAGGVDKIWFTNEEQADMWRSMLKGYEPFKLAQRLIALIVIPAFIFGWLVSLAVLVATIWHPDLKSIAETIFAHTNEALGIPVSLIIGFYFAGGMTEGIITRTREKAKEKKSENG